MAKSKEYDAFGPWILEINDEYPMPPLYIKHYHEKETPLMLIKIPRNIDRRNATPDMNLYDYVVGMFASYLYILKRVRNSVEEKRVWYKDIVAVRSTAALLSGELVFFLKGEAIIINYNTVSKEIMDTLADIIRGKYSTEIHCLDIAPLEYDINKIEHYYALLIDQMKRKDAKIRMVAYQPLWKLEPKYPRLNKAFSFLIRRKVLSNTALITNDRELIILERELPVRYIKSPDFTYSCLYLPYQTITDVETADALGIRECKTLKIRVQDKLFSFLYGNNNIQIKALYQALKRYSLKR